MFIILKTEFEVNDPRRFSPRKHISFSLDMVDLLLFQHLRFAHLFDSDDLSSLFEATNPDLAKSTSADYCHELEVIDSNSLPPRYCYLFF